MSGRIHRGSSDPDRRHQIHCEIIGKELLNGDYEPRCYARACAQCDGDENLRRSIYAKERMDSLQKIDAVEPFSAVLNTDSYEKRSSRKRRSSSKDTADGKLEISKLSGYIDKLLKLIDVSLKHFCMALAATGSLIVYRLWSDGDIDERIYWQVILVVVLSLVMPLVSYLMTLPWVADIEYRKILSIWVPSLCLLSTISGFYLLKAGIPERNKIAEKAAPKVEHVEVLVPAMSMQQPDDLGSEITMSD